MNRARRPPLQHPLADCFDRAVESLGAALNPETIRHYRGTARNFLSYLGTTYPEVMLTHATSPRSPHPRVDVSSTLPNAAADDRLLHQPADRSALDLA